MFFEGWGFRGGGVPKIAWGTSGEPFGILGSIREAAPLGPPSLEDSTMPFC